MNEPNTNSWWAKTMNKTTNKKKNKKEMGKIEAISLFRKFARAFRCVAMEKVQDETN
jgi:hypothetical protein